MKKRIICMILSLAAVFSFFGFEATKAWFSAGDKKIQTLAAGDLSYTVEGELKAPDGRKVLPGDVVTPEGGLKVTNESNIDSNLRVRIALSYTDADGKAYDQFFTGSDDDYIKVTFANENWVLNGDYFYYYPGGKSETDTIDSESARIPAATEENNVIPFISSIEFSGEKIDDHTIFSGKVITLTVTFQSKQADYVNWTNLGTIEMA